MAKTFLLIILTGLLCLWSGGCRIIGIADEAAWERYNQAGVSAYQRGDYAEVTKQWEAALKEKDFDAQDPRLATSLNNLAGLYRAQGQYAKAEPLLQRALAIREKALGPAHPDVAQSLENYAALLRKLDRTTEAETMEVRAKAIRAAAH